MKNTLFLIACLTTLVTWSQNVQVDAQTYTPQQLIEDILIDSNCITNVVVTNTVGGDFSDSDQSYGYFDASGSSFPFQNGIVLSTGRLNNVQGPNTSLSDDDAANWIGDTDLETVLQESNTLNATIIEFDFEAVASQVSFRYIFASEEYQEGNDNTCRFSDLFGFLIRPASSAQYENIALVPETSTPVKVTTVHSGIPGSCQPINEQYFGSWNNALAPINFNGQTAILTATADVVPNSTYHVKLVIADEQNYRYDSAVFLEAGSFQLSTNLGPDLLVANNNALCTDETLELDATEAEADSYKWFKDGTEETTETNATYQVTQPGTYNVEVTINSTCISYGEIIIEYAPDPIVFNTTLIACDINLDGFTTYNLFNAISNITNNDSSLIVVDFYETQLGAEGSNVGLISNPSSYENTSIGQTVYARVTNSNGCISVAEVNLDIANNPVSLPPFRACDEDNDGIVSLDINALESFIISQPDVPNSVSVTFYNSENDLTNQDNPISGNYENSDSPYSDVLYIQITDNNNCFAFTTLQLQVFDSPEFQMDETFIYCLNEYPQVIELQSGITNNNNSSISYSWYLNGIDLMLTTETIQVNEVGTYRVLASNSNDCSASRDIIVEPSNIATIESIIVADGIENNTISITVSGEGDYEYALDYGVYQDEPFFTNVLADTHTLLVRDKNGCGVILEEVPVFGFPKFFTPNGDGINDTWSPKGISSKNIVIRIKIFDRYGKLIKEINASENNWDGTFNGEPLITDDYWYHAVIPNGRTFNGHFTLKR
jgi:gliding motility-associated-like protein